MDLTKFDQYLVDEKEAIDESSPEKKARMYSDGCWAMKHAFQDFSQYYMKAMGLMTQSKSSMDEKYKKYRDSVSKAYERLDDAISKHVEVMQKDYNEKMKEQKTSVVGR